MAMKTRTTDRTAPGVGAASLLYDQKKFHQKMLRDVKSRVSSQFNDNTWVRHRTALSHFKKDNGRHAVRQIDQKNLQMFIRLSSVQPSVPVVVKRSVLQSVELNPATTGISMDNQTNVEQTYQLESPFATQDEQRSISVPRQAQKFSLNLTSAQKVDHSPNFGHSSTKELIGNDGASLLDEEQNLKGGKNGAMQSMAALPSAAQNPHQDTSQQTLNSSAYQSARTIKRTTQWYLKSPSKVAYFDQAYKVVPTLNHQQRLGRLDQITKENQKMFQRLQGVKANYDTTQILENSYKQESRKQHISGFAPDGRAKKDPLWRKHERSDSISKRQKSTFDPRGKSSVDSSPAKLGGGDNVYENMGQKALLGEVVNSKDIMSQTVDKSFPHMKNSHEPYSTKMDSASAARDPQFVTETSVGDYSSSNMATAKRRYGAGPVRNGSQQLIKTKRKTADDVTATPDITIDRQQDSEQQSVDDRKIHTTLNHYRANGDLERSRKTVASMNQIGKHNGLSSRQEPQFVSHQRLRPVKQSSAQLDINVNNQEQLMKEIQAILPTMASQKNSIKFQGYKHKGHQRDWIDPNQHQSMRLGRSVKVLTSREAKSSNRNTKELAKKALDQKLTASDNHTKYYSGVAIKSGKGDAPDMTPQLLPKVFTQRNPNAKISKDASQVAQPRMVQPDYSLVGGDPIQKREQRMEMMNRTVTNESKSMMHSSRENVSVNSGEKVSIPVADKEGIHRRISSPMTMQQAYGLKASNQEFVKLGPLLKSKVTLKTEAKAKAQTQAPQNITVSATVLSSEPPIQKIAETERALANETPNFTQQPKQESMPTVSTNKPPTQQTK